MNDLSKNKIKWSIWFPQFWAWSIFIPYLLVFSILLSDYLFLRGTGFKILSFILFLVIFCVFLLSAYKENNFLKSSNKQNQSLTYLNHPIPWLLSAISFSPLILLSLGKINILASYIYIGLLWGFLNVLFISTRMFKKYVRKVTPISSEIQSKHKNLLELFSFAIILPIYGGLGTFISASLTGFFPLDLLLATPSFFYIPRSIIFHLYFKIAMK